MNNYFIFIPHYLFVHLFCFLHFTLLTQSLDFSLHLLDLLCERVELHFCRRVLPNHACLFLRAYGINEVMISVPCNKGGLILQKLYRYFIYSGYVFYYCSYHVGRGQGHALAETTNLAVNLLCQALQLMHKLL